MKKLTFIGILTMLCLYLAGCGSPDKSQQDIAQPTGQAQAAALTQETSVRKTGTRHSVPDGTAWQRERSKSPDCPRRHTAFYIRGSSRHSGNTVNPRSDTPHKRQKAAEPETLSADSLRSDGISTGTTRSQPLQNPAPADNDSPSSICP